MHLLMFVHVTKYGQPCVYLHVTFEINCLPQKVEHIYNF